MSNALKSNETAPQISVEMSVKIQAMMGELFQKTIEAMMIPPPILDGQKEQERMVEELDAAGFKVYIYKAYPLIYAFTYGGTLSQIDHYIVAKDHTPYACDTDLKKAIWYTYQKWTFENRR